MSMTGFSQITKLLKNQSKNEAIGIDFNDTIQQVHFEFEIKYDDDNQNQVKIYNLSISCPCGELLQANFLSENEFNNIQGKNI
jgi:hypothetical protein